LLLNLGRVGHWVSRVGDWVRQLGCARLNPGVVGHAWGKEKAGVEWAAWERKRQKGGEQNGLTGLCGRKGKEKDEKRKIGGVGRLEAFNPKQFRKRFYF
jgi:hypothetical protein